MSPPGVRLGILCRLCFRSCPQLPLTARHRPLSGHSAPQLQLTRLLWLGQLRPAALRYQLQLDRQTYPPWLNLQLPWLVLVLVSLLVLSLLRVGMSLL